MTEQEEVNLHVKHAVAALAGFLLLTVVGLVLDPEDPPPEYGTVGGWVGLVLGAAWSVGCLTWSKHIVNREIRANHVAELLAQGGLEEDYRP